jgi:peroxin-6
VHTLHSVSPNKTQRRDAPIEIQILDAVPLGLDTVFVSLDTEALRKLDEVHAKFGGGFGFSRPNGAAKGPKDRFLEVNGTGSKTKNAVDIASQEQGWKNAVRDALKAPTIVHTGDLLPLPIPSHPITHVPPPPAKVTACEPVSQGLLLPTTKIVVLRSHGHSKSSKVLPPVHPPMFPNGVGDDDDDTSNETFYSAAEERTPSQGATPPEEDL